jgi:hypothetical protein
VALPQNMTEAALVEKALTSSDDLPANNEESISK